MLLASADHSPKFHAVAISALDWLGAHEEMARALTTADDPAFENAIKQLPPEDMPVDIRTLGFGPVRSPIALHDLLRSLRMIELILSRYIATESEVLPHALIERSWTGIGFEIGVAGDTGVQNDAYRGEELNLSPCVWM